MSNSTRLRFIQSLCECLFEISCSWWSAPISFSIVSKPTHIVPSNRMYWALFFCTYTDYSNFISNKQDIAVVPFFLCVSFSFSLSYIWFTSNGRDRETANEWTKLKKETRSRCVMFRIWAHCKPSIHFLLFNEYNIFFCCRSSSFFHRRRRHRHCRCCRSHCIDQHWCFFTDYNWFEIALNFLYRATHSTFSNVIFIFKLIQNIKRKRRVEEEKESVAILIRKCTALSDMEKTIEKWGDF